MIYLAGDTHGWKAISFVIDYLNKKGLSYENLGVKNGDEDMALEVMLPPVADLVKKGHTAIVSCGTGVGVEVGINKISGVRATLATNPDIAKWAVEKDKCNVLCLVGWQANAKNISEMLDAWFSAVYDGNEKRLTMMKVFDTWH